jgi:hypothetical protein
MKLCIFTSIFTIVFFAQLLNAAKPKQSLLDVPRFKSISCNFTEELLAMIYPNTTCKVYQIDRRLGALTIYVFFKQPVHAIIVIIFKRKFEIFGKIHSLMVSVI